MQFEEKILEQLLLCDNHDKVIFKTKQIKKSEERSVLDNLYMPMKGIKGLGKITNFGGEKDNTVIYSIDLPATKALDNFSLFHDQKKR